MPASIMSTNSCLLYTSKGLDIVGVRHNAYQAECLVRSRQEVSELYPDLIIDRANIEEIMLFYIRGQKQ